MLKPVKAVEVTLFDENHTTLKTVIYNDESSYTIIDALNTNASDDAHMGDFFMVLKEGVFVDIQKVGGVIMTVHEMQEGTND